MRRYVYSLPLVTSGRPRNQFATVTPAPRQTGRWRGATPGLAVVVVVTLLVGCATSSHKSSKAALSLAIISQRYHAAVQPANAATSDVAGRALAYQGGSTASLDSSLPPAVTTLQSSAHALDVLDALTAPVPLQQAIVTVAGSLNSLVQDMTTLQGAQGGAVQPAIARVVADAGREAAADNAVGLLLTLLATPLAPATTSLIPLPAGSTTTSTTAAATTTTSAATTTTLSTATATTMPRPSTTTVPRTTTTPPTTATTIAPATTTTTRPHTTTTNILHLP